MPLDREETLKKAEKLLRQGRLDGAIAEYVRVVEDQPRDWTTANTLGDLYVRANQPDKAVAQYTRIADHLFREGFYPKAAALYKKILKILPEHEAAQLSLGDVSAKQGLLADAKTHLSGVAARRRARGDTRGADDIVIKLGEIDPSDIDARIAAARLLTQRGDNGAAAAIFRQLHADLLEKGRGDEALEALREAVRLDPGDVQSRAALAKAALETGDLESARAYLDRDVAGSDPALLLALADVELRGGNLDQARDLLPQLIGRDRGMRHTIVELAWTLSATSPEAALVCVDAAVNAATSADDFEDAAAVLQEFVMRQPGHIPSLLKLVEVSVDGGLESTMYDAQAQLADAYLAAGKGAEARVISEDLVAREPWEPAHIDRFRRALVMLRVSEPDSVIAERLGGQAPFVARDHFADPGAASAASDQNVASGDTQTGSAQEPAVAEAPTVIAAGAGRESARPAPGSLDEVFTGMREDAARAAAKDDPVQQLKLGDTYLEMGMIDEAAEALKAASRMPRLRFEAASKLARLCRERGDTAHALEWFERAAEAPAPTPDDGHALFYDLAVTLEDLGETARALAIFLELLAETGGYRDVSDRADRLTRVQTGG